MSDAAQVRRDGAPRMTTSVLLDNIDHSATWRRDYEQIWSACWDWYRGNISPYMYSRIRDGELGSDRGTRESFVNVNEIKGVVDLLEARTAMRSPKFYAHPRFPSAQGNAATAETVINYFWRSRNTSDAFRLAQKFNIVNGHGWMRVSWHLHQNTRPHPAETIDAETDRRRRARDAAMAVDPDAQYPSDDELRSQVEDEYRRSPVVVAHDEYPVARWVNPFDVYVDPAATSMTDARWVAQREWRPVHVVAANDSYSRTARTEVRDLGGSQQSRFARRSRNQGAGSAQRETPHVKWVELFEYHDLEAGKWCRFARDAAHFLIKPIESPYKGSVYRSPFEMLRNHEVLAPDWSMDFYPQGDVEQLISLNWELNETRTSLMAHRASLSSMWAVRSDRLDRTTRAQLQSPRPGVVISIPSDVPINDAVKPLQPAPIQPQLFDLAGQSRFDLGRVAGISDLDRGVAEVERRSATEAAALADAGQSRIESKITAAQESASRIGGRFLMLAQMFLTKQSVVRISGPGPEDGAEWAQFDRAAILGQYDIEIEHGSMAPRNDAQKRQDVSALVGMLGPLAQSGRLDVAKLAELVLSEFGIDNAADFIVDAAPPPPGDANPLALLAGSPGQA